MGLLEEDPLTPKDSQSCFFMNVIPLLISIIYLGIELPKTKNRTVLDIMKNLGYKEDQFDYQTVKKNGDMVRLDYGAERMSDLCCDITYLELLFFHKPVFLAG